MLTQQLEKKIVDAIVGEIPSDAPAYQVFGAWQPSTAGIVKGEENHAAVATIAVSLGTRQQETYTTGVASFAGSIALVVRFELDTTGTALVTFASAIEGLFSAWQSQTYQQAFTALDLPAFSVDDVSANGGQPASIDFNRKTVSVDWSFVLKGSDRTVTNN